MLICALKTIRKILYIRDDTQKYCKYVHLVCIASNFFMDPTHYSCVFEEKYCRTKKQC
jgi:hypothetical protein